MSVLEVYDQGTEAASANGNGHYPTPVAEPLSLILPESFYTARAELKEIRDYAHSRGAAADVVLYGDLSRISGMVPHQCRLDTGIGPTMGASLNLFTAAIGPSGTGKSTGASVARDICPTPTFLDFADGLPLGSGEGIAEAYMGWDEQDTGEVYRQGDKKGEPKKKPVRCQVRHNAFFVADEGEALTKMIERAGATIGPTIRSAWYGQTLGQQNASADRNRKVPEGEYSMGMLIGFQPETVLPLLRDAATGTPQRFAFCSTIDPTKPLHTYRRVAVTPKQFVVRAEKMHLQPSIAEEVRRDHHEYSTGAAVVSRLDAHRNLTMLKLGALLALLGGRYVVDEDDWHLADIMWGTSCAVRDHYLKQADIAEARDRYTRNLYNADREEMAEVRRQQVRAASTKVERIARLIAKHVHASEKPAKTIGEAGRRLKSDNRDCLTEALDYAVLEGWVEVDGTNVTPGPSRPA